MESFSMVATTLHGLEELLAEELKTIGATDINKLIRAVEFKGTKETLYKANLHLRTALKILKPLDNFMVRDSIDLYKKVKRINWDEYLEVNGTMSVESTVNSDHFTHSQFVSLKTKDAIVDQFREKYNERPSIDLKDPDLKINIHISDRRLTVSLDSSGASLGKRGYRKAQGLAPMSEVLAAGIIALSGWDKQTDLLDPMCGSGTFPIEAALIAANVPPGRFRDFGFQKWKDYDQLLWQQIITSADADKKPINCKIFGSDIDSRSVEISKSNALNAKVGDLIEFTQMDFIKSEEHFKDALILINPPYGERLKEEEEIIPFYQEIGTKLKHYCEGCNAFIISSNMQALKFVGLRPSSKIKLFNGPLECRLFKFELFRGKKNERFEQNKDA